jgi:atypical dual specificity phosphatase
MWKNVQERSLSTMRYIDRQYYIPLMLSLAIFLSILGNGKLATIPFVYMMYRAVPYSSVLTYLLLICIWGGYLLLGGLVFILVIGRHYVLILYLPICVYWASKSMKNPDKSQIFLTAQVLFWDTPLLLWGKCARFLGMRAFSPFYSEINSSIAVGSLPLNRDDVFELHAKGVRAVVNMCRENIGPKHIYDELDITQLRVSTPDLCEPSIGGVLDALDFIETQILGGKKVFIHCKGGRSRAVCMTACWLVSTGMSSHDALKLIKTQRSVAISSSVNRSVVVKHVEAIYKDHPPRVSKAK